MSDAAAYKEHLNPNMSRRETLEALTYDEWQASVSCYVLFEPYLASYDEPYNELAEVIPYTDGLIARLHEQYEFRDDVKVESYIEQYPSLSNLLTDAHDKIRKYFGSDAHAVLEMVKGRETDDDERLFVYIQTELSSDEALDRLDDLYEQWWLDALSGVRPKLSIDVEYV
ncbi:MAG: hypothetical protein CYG60_16210 [Actinobacteria bacterium]|nr:MAG: hypothetical protein CYG60_16210 [Actinomycetota bacterium]